jgi:hypothetical protein
VLEKETIGEVELAQLKDEIGRLRGSSQAHRLIAVAE